MTNKDAIRKILVVSSIIIAILAFIMMFLPALSLTVAGATENVNGYEIVFGKKSQGLQFLNFSFGSLLTYLLVLAGGISFFVGNKKDNKKMKIYAIICFILSTIFFFCTKEMMVIDRAIFQTNLTDEGYALAVNMFKGMMKNSVGVILGGILCILCTITITLELLLDKIYGFFENK